MRSRYRQLTQIDLAPLAVCRKLDITVKGESAAGHFERIDPPHRLLIHRQSDLTAGWPSGGFLPAEPRQRQLGFGQIKRSFQPGRLAAVFQIGAGQADSAAQNLGPADAESLPGGFVHSPFEADLAGGRDITDKTFLPDKLRRRRADGALTGNFHPAAIKCQIKPAIGQILIGDDIRQFDIGHMRSDGNGHIVYR